MPTEKKTDLSKVEILKAFNPQYAKWSKPKEVQDRSIMKDILAMEEQKVLAPSFFPPSPFPFLKKK